ncbi:hypothetical protein [Acinetobacter modestus]|uniref:hypothetical protein n=1 Tax=Acinetobacter modestus TaxID=1776740 RepID=UPI003207AACA
MNIFGKFLLIALLFMMSHLAYAESDIQQGNILAFDPNVACRILATELKKMEQTLAEKKDIIKDSEKSLTSAATPSIKYGNILLEYHRMLDQFNSMKKDYDRLLLAQEKYCISDQDKQSIN